MSKYLLQPREQSTVAAGAAVVLAVGAVWWVVEGGMSGRLIEVDQAPTVPYEFLVDVNQAEWPELAQLPEVGEVLARRIVAQRETQGAFRSQDDLLEVDGIGRVKLSRIAPHLVPLPDDATMVSR